MLFLLNYVIQEESVKGKIMNKDINKSTGNIENIILDKNTKSNEENLIDSKIIDSQESKSTEKENNEQSSSNNSVQSFFAMASITSFVALWLARSKK